MITPIPRVTLLCLSVWAFGAIGCATTTSPGRIVRGPEMRVIGGAVGPDALDIYDAQTLLERGLDLLEGGQDAEAARYFERLVKEFTDDETVPLAHYNLAVAYIHLKRGDEAVFAAENYLRTLPKTATPHDRLDGHFKRGQALAEAKRYQDVADLFDGMLQGELKAEVGELTPAERIEALVDAGVGHFMLNNHATAEFRFFEAQRVYRQGSERARLEVEFFVAQASFYLGEVARVEFAEARLAYPTADEIAGAKGKTLEELLGKKLEEKCQLLLRAQYAYIRAIRHGHPGWASAAGFKVGSMYEDLHNELISLPAPDDLSEEARTLYTALVRKRILVLLEKAERTWTSTADMVTRTGAESEWSKRTAESLARIRQKILEESALAKAADDDKHKPGES